MSTQPDINSAFLTLTQWFSPLYPVGAFAYSHGLENAIETGDVASAAALRDWVEDVLRFGGGWSDALFLASAYRAPNLAAVQQIDQSCRAFAPSSERLKETVLQGEAFAQITGDVWDTGRDTLCFPVAVGRAAGAQNLPLELTISTYLQAFMSNLVSVGMRLVPLGQTEGQKIIRALTPLCQEVAKASENGTLEELSSTAFLTDIASMKHETQYSRIFRT